MDIENLSDEQKAQLVENRWQSSASLWGTHVTQPYETNTKYYDNKPDWLQGIPRRQPKVRANRIFVDTEMVINSLIANPPQPQFIPTRDTPDAKELAQLQEDYFLNRYRERNVKETLRKGLRNLYFGRLIILKPFWDAKIDDFNVRAIDPRNVRFGKTSTKEDDSEFAIEEITDTLSALLERFPDKQEVILKQAGLLDPADILINNPEVKYKEAWIRDYVIFKYGNAILGCIRNPYWDWDGLLVTPQEEENLAQLSGQARRDAMLDVRTQQDERKQTILARAQEELGAVPVTEGMESEDEEAQEAAYGIDPALEVRETQGGSDATMQPSPSMEDIRPYFFNHFDRPRKPYIFATILNNENTPVGRTDMITQAIPLQENIDATKRDITRNAHFVNGVWIIDAEVMDKAEAQRLDSEATGKIWGKGAVAGVRREVGNPLPAFVVENMQDSRNEVDNIMAASSAFRGEREGQETKAGRLALIDQSYLRLNELVQVVDYVNYELFNWFYQIAKVRYTSTHQAKEMGEDRAVRVLELMQDDFEYGTDIRIIGGKTLPEDRQFKYEQAQADVQKGILSPADYFEVAGYEQPNEKAKNAVKFQLNPALAVGLSPEEIQAFAPPQQPDMPSRSISFKDLPIDGQVQMAEQAGIQLNPQLLVAKELMAQEDKERDIELNKAKVSKGNPPKNGK